MSHMHAPPAPQRHDSPLPDNSSQHAVASGSTFQTTDAAHKNDTRSTETMTNENNKPSFHQPLRSIMYKLSLSCNSNSSNSNNSSESRSSRNRSSNSSKSKQRKHRQLATRPKNHVVENVIREDVAALMENPTSSSRSITTNEPHGASNVAASRTSDERRNNSHQQNLGNSSSTTFDTTSSGDDDGSSSSIRSDTRSRRTSNGVPRVIVAAAAATQAAGENDAIISTINTRINSLHLSTSGTGRGITSSRTTEPSPTLLQESANDENLFNSSRSSSRSNRRGTTRNGTTEGVPVVSTVPRRRRHHHNATTPHATTTAAPVGARPNRGQQQRPRGNVGPTDQQTTLPRPRHPEDGAHHTTSAAPAAAAVGTEDPNTGFRPTTSHVPITHHSQPTLNDDNDDNDDKAFQKAKSILAAGPVELKGRIKFEPTALLESVAAADFKEVRMLLSYGANPNAAIPATTSAVATATNGTTTMTTCHETALAMAVKAGHLYIVALLLANGATIATTPTTTIDDSTTAHHHATAARRRRRSHYHCTTVLHHACAAGHMSIVRLLLFHLQQQQRQKGEPNAAADHALALADDDPSSFAALHQQLPASAMMLLHWTDVQGRTPLFWASHRGHTAVVRLLLEYGAGSDLFTTDRAGQSPLHAASSHGHVAALQLLLLAAASSSLAAAAAAAQEEEDNNNEEEVGTVNERQQQQQQQHGETAMAVYCNLPDMEGRTALDLACRHGHLAAMQVLLGHGADCNGSSGSSNSNNIIMKNTTPLMEATRQENVPMIRLLLAFGASVVATPSYNSTRGGGSFSSSSSSSNSNTNAAANALAPLHMASRQGRADIVSLLLQDHTPAALPHILRQTDPTSGRTALHWACCRGHVEVVHLILAFLNSSARSAGDGSTDNDPQRRRRRLQRNKVVCNIADTSYGDTPLLIAAKQRHWDAVQLLLTQGGADPNARDRMGGTALDVALKQDHWESVKLLLDHGANVNFPDRLYRRTPLHRAAYNNQLELLKLMMERGANTRARDRSSRVALHLACEQENISSIYLLFQVMVGEGSITFSSSTSQGRHKRNRNRKYRS